MENRGQPLSLPEKTIQRIDWLSIAPWILLLRVPGAVFGWPFVAGAVGALLFGGMASPGVSTEGDPVTAVRIASEALRSFPFDSFRSIGETLTLADQTIGWRLSRLLVATLGVVVWGGLAVVIADRVALSLTEAPRRGLFSSVRRAVAALPSLIGCAIFAMAFVTTVLAFWPWLTHALLVEAWQPITLVTASMWGVVVLVSLLLTIGLIVVGAAALLLPAALAVERCDAFDATSRSFAYATQRLGGLTVYVAITAVLGIVAGAAVELVFDAGMSLTYAAFPPLTQPESLGATTASSLAGVWTAVLARVVDGFYPAYFFASMTGIYLLLRRDVDGQPIDQMAD